MNWYLVGGIVLVAILAAISQWRAEHQRKQTSDEHMWDAADEALCTAQRNKQLAETPPRSFGSLPTLDEFKRRAHRS